MAVNVPLMYKTLDHIREHPEEYNQEDWARRTACGTVACFAGTAVTLAGYEFDFTIYGLDSTDILTNGKSILEVARLELGITKGEAAALFFAGNSLNEVETFVDMIVGSLPVPVYEMMT